MTFIKVIKINGTHRLIPDNTEETINANRFLNAIEIRRLSPCTVRGYGFDLVCLLNWLKRSKNIFADMNQSVLLKFIDAENKRKAAPRSINRRLSTCRSFYEFCFGQEIPSSIGTNLPSPHYKGPGKDRRLGIFQRNKKTKLVLKVRVPKLLIVPLEPKEVNRFIDKFFRYRDCAIVRLMLLCGLRSCEVLSLRMENVNLHEQHVRINGKGDKQRMMPLPLSLVQTMQKYLELERPPNVSHNYFFVVMQGVRKGQPMTTEGLRRLFRYRREQINLMKANPHRWRHTFATEMARMGVPLPVLQEMLGHADPTMTLQYIRLAMTDISTEYNRAMEMIHSRYDKT